VGGSGFRTQPWPLLPQHKPQLPNGDVDRFNATLGFESSTPPRIAAPLLWLGSTNDFHGLMDDTSRTALSIPHQDVRYSFTPHMNQSFHAGILGNASAVVRSALKGIFSCSEDARRLI
jgi:hypothetical protein